MLIADYHNHPQAHRTDLPYSQKTLQPWADKAKELGLQDLAFTDHDRYKDGVSFDEIDKLREGNPGLNFRAGIELDNDPETSIDGHMTANFEALSVLSTVIDIMESFVRTGRKVGRKRVAGLRNLVGTRGPPIAPSTRARTGLPRIHESEELSVVANAAHRDANQRAANASEDVCCNAIQPTLIMNRSVTSPMAIATQRRAPSLLRLLLMARWMETAIRAASGACHHHPRAAPRTHANQAA